MGARTASFAGARHYDGFIGDICLVDGIRTGPSSDERLAPVDREKFSGVDLILGNFERCLIATRLLRTSREIFENVAGII